MYNSAQCLVNVRKIHPDGRLCSAWLCAQAGTAISAFCECQPPFPPQNPCPYEPNTPVAIYDNRELCYCCCGAPRTEVAVDAGEERDVGDVWVGHMVRVARRAAN